MITFIPTDGDHANKILGHLADFSQWQYPDLRATISLFENLSKIEFPTVQANLLPGKNGSQLILLRKIAKFPKPWETRSVLVNKDLAGYLTEHGVKP